ncbi:hypothetical protein [Bremerella cremea]|uniref:hypothetical protein n=1 Tax=Bremerella cremea TaxID=1031537 RepID=UPI0013145A32|nr:hypothetical protein [Bremerella cremea]
MTRSWKRFALLITPIKPSRKRCTIQSTARNLGLILRTLFGIGTARSLQGLASLLLALQLALILVERRLRILVQL